MNPTKVVGCREIPRTPEEFHKLGARLDSELSVVRPFTRKHGFVFKARTWDELAKWESQRLIEEHLQRHQ
jgi:hypothetical protein